MFYEYIVLQCKLYLLHGSVMCLRLLSFGFMVIYFCEEDLPKMFLFILTKKAVQDGTTAKIVVFLIGSCIYS